MGVMKRIAGMKASRVLLPGDVMIWLRETGVCEGPARRPARKLRQINIFDDVKEKPAVILVTPPARDVAPPFEPGSYRNQRGIISYARQIK